jgi:hypothetical protein
VIDDNIGILDGGRPRKKPFTEALETVIRAEAEGQRSRPSANIGSGAQQSSRPGRGRKPAHESRAAEFRRELIIWKQAPESSRPTLRALATKLGASHQILAYHKNRLGR